MADGVNIGGRCCDGPDAVALEGAEGRMCVLFRVRSDYWDRYGSYFERDGRQVWELTDAQDRDICKVVLLQKEENGSMIVMANVGATRTVTHDDEISSEWIAFKRCCPRCEDLMS